MGSYCAVCRWWIGKYGCETGMCRAPAVAYAAQRSPLEVAREALEEIRDLSVVNGKCRSCFGVNGEHLDGGNYRCFIASRALRRMDAPAATPAAVPVETPPPACGKVGPHCVNGRCPNPECDDEVSGEWDDFNEFECSSCGSLLLASEVGDGSWTFRLAFEDATADQAEDATHATPPTPAQPCATCNGTRIMRKFSGAVECPDCVATPAQPGARSRVPWCTCPESKEGTLEQEWAHKKASCLDEDVVVTDAAAIPPREGMPGEPPAENGWRHGFVVHNEGGCGWRGPTARRFTNDRCGLAAKHPFHVATPPSSTPPGERET